MFYNLKQKVIIGAVAVLAVAGNASAGPCRAAVSTISTASSGLGDVYFNYRGNGSPDAGWPTKDKWMSFDQLWDNNVPLMTRACNDDWLTVPGGKPGNSPHEMEVLRQAILNKATDGNVDPRVVLAVVLQESRGCVRVSPLLIILLSVVNHILGSLYGQRGLQPRFDAITRWSR